MKKYVYENPVTGRVVWYDPEIVWDTPKIRNKYRTPIFFEEPMFFPHRTFVEPLNLAMLQEFLFEHGRSEFEIEEYEDRSRTPVFFLPEGRKGNFNISFHPYSLFQSALCQGFQAVDLSELIDVLAERFSGVSLECIAVTHVLCPSVCCDGRRMWSMRFSRQDPVLW